MPNHLMAREQEVEVVEDDQGRRDFKEEREQSQQLEIQGQDSDEYFIGEDVEDLRDPVSRYGYGNGNGNGEKEDDVAASSSVESSIISSSESDSGSDEEEVDSLQGSSYRNHLGQYQSMDMSTSRNSTIDLPPSPTSIYEIPFPEHLALSQEKKLAVKASVKQEDFQLPIPYTRFLKPGVKFMGEQKSRRGSYGIEINLESVDLEASLLSGTLTIHNLTTTHPTLSTFFEGEVVGYGRGGFEFLTGERKGWGGGRDCEVDKDHWGLFNSFAPFKERFDVDPTFKYKTHPAAKSSPYIHMRWKETHLLTPSPSSPHSTHIPGASFAGFYYMSLDRRSGKIEGVYFWRGVEMFQRVELQDVEGRFDGGEYEFR